MLASILTMWNWHPEAVVDVDSDRVSCPEKKHLQHTD